MLKGKAQLQEGEQPFQTANNQGRELMLDAQVGNSRHSAFSYSYLVSIDADLPSLIVLKFTTDEVHIKGNGLESLYQSFLSQRVRLVRESTDLSSENEVNIRQIKVIPKTH